MKLAGDRYKGIEDTKKTTFIINHQDTMNICGV